MGRAAFKVYLYSIDSREPCNEIFTSFHKPLRKPVIDVIGRGT